MADDMIGVRVTYTDAKTGNPGEISDFQSMQTLVDSDCTALRKGDAVVVYAQTLGYVTQLIESGQPDMAVEVCQQGLDVLEESASRIADTDLDEIADLLERYCKRARRRSFLWW